MKIDFKSKKTIILAGLILLVILLLSIGVYLYFFKKPNQNLIGNQITHPPCLGEDEIVDYNINWRQHIGPVDIIIKKQQDNKEAFRFTVDSVFSGAYPVQPRKCGVYVLRLFNYDPQKSKQSPGYKEEIWYYSYNGNGEPLLLLGIKDELGNFHNFFSLEFKIDFIEELIALIRGYFGKMDFATVIKEIKTKEDVFELLLSDIISKHPSLEGNIALIDWTKDSRYFWGRAHYGAYTLGFFRIDASNWNVEIFEAPEGVLGGSALNIEKGYVTRHPGHVWIGIQQAVEQEKQEWREQGKISSLYLYNLFSKEQNLIATTSEPLWFFQPKWISDTDLEYELPSGEKKVYNIENK